jgi:hypothetical protein
MKVKPPADRRKFANAWDEIEYLYSKLLYWLYQREDNGKARRYADRLERILRKADPNGDAILGQECRSLICETRGDLAAAIKHRENEIRLIRRLHESIRNTPHQEFALKDYGYDALSDRLDLLATVHRENGNLNKALAVLRESQELCKANGIRFDGEDLLQKYAEEKNKPAANSGRIGKEKNRAVPVSSRKAV